MGSLERFTPVGAYAEFKVITHSYGKFAVVPVLYMDLIDSLLREY
jgi:hypothetical protein